MQLWGAKGTWESLYPPLNFVVNTKPLLKKVFKKISLKGNISITLRLSSKREREKKTISRLNYVNYYIHVGKNSTKNIHLLCIK